MSSFIFNLPVLFEIYIRGCRLIDSLKIKKKKQKKMVFEDHLFLRT